jgi:hypothetical protein
MQPRLDSHLQCSAKTEAAGLIQTHTHMFASDDLVSDDAMTAQYIRRLLDIYQVCVSKPKTTLRVPNISILR